jgi:hypothetical protein
MAFNFFGTFTTGQFNDLINFSKIQLADIERKRSWLARELLRVGVFKTEYDERNYPKSFTVSPPDSYAGKLFQAYKILGGIPETTMLLRNSDDPVFLIPGSDLSTDPNDTTSGVATTFTNGRRDRGNIRFDRSVGIMVDALKKWQLDSIKLKRESLEFKIKRALDYSDQLQNEIKLLEKMQEESSPYSLTSLIANVAGTVFTAGAMNIVNNALDVFGLDIGTIGDYTLRSDHDQQNSLALRMMGGAVNQSLGDDPKNPTAGDPGPQNS